MAKWNNDETSDQGLDWVKANFDNVYICKSSPNTYAQATSTLKLGTAAHTIGGSPQDNGSTGREIVVSAKSSIGITAAGQMKTVALCKTAGSILAYVTDIPASSQASVSASDKVNMATWDIQINDVSA